MKKTIMTIMVLVCTCSSTMADGIKVADITIPKGGEAVLNIELDNPTTQFAAFQFNIQLCDGIAPATNEFGKLVYAKGARFGGDDFSLSMSNTESNTYLTLGYYTVTQAIPGTSGTIVAVTLKADAALETGSTYQGKLTALNLTTPDETKQTPDNLTFTITIGEPADTRVVIDEDATTAPEDASGVDIRVKRSIRAGTWNTICLPFAMTEAQVQEAFGSDVELADFEGITSDTDADDNITDITVNFSAATSIEPNHPYLIKVSTAVTEFTVDGVDIVVEEEPSIDKDGYTVGKGKTAVTFYNRMVGTYTTSGMVPNLCLFLSNGQFWYSTGITPMKGLRAYFDFYDVLTDVENTYSIKMRVDDTTTRINLPATTQIKEEGAMYDLSGRRLSIEHRKGIIIINGKKVLEK